MTDCYLPRRDETVRVTAVHPEDSHRLAVGSIVVVKSVCPPGPTPGRRGSEFDEWPLVAFVGYGDIWCRVESVEEREESAPELACYCGHAGCHQCDRAPEPAEPERHFCACGAEAWPRNGSVPLDYYGRPICSDCSSDQERVCLDEGTLAPLDTRIREAQPVYELGPAWSTATDES